jgi:hypothetical protein
MDRILKPLIAVACVVVIAVGGVYTYGQLRESHERAAAQEAATRRAAADAEAAKARAEEDRRADCTRRVPSQSTENLKRLFDQCMQGI